MKSRKQISFCYKAVVIATAINRVLTIVLIESISGRLDMNIVIPALEMVM